MAGSSKAFTLRNNTPISEYRHAVGRRISLPKIEGRTDSVFDASQVPKLQNLNVQKKKKVEKRKQKKGSEDVDSDECLHIEFAELLAEPENKYIPSLHGWRYWCPNREWIDPDGARTDAVQAVEERRKELPSKNYGPPLP
nr:uncharacterized protein LOC106689558 [Halyomorpha halys]